MKFRVGPLTQQAIAPLTGQHIQVDRIAQPTGPEMRAALRYYCSKCGRSRVTRISWEPGATEPDDPVKFVHEVPSCPNACP